MAVRLWLYVLSPPFFIALIAGAAQISPSSASAPAITLQDALARAQQFSGQLDSANLAARLAHEDKVQARAASLPTISGLNQFIYTEGNGTPSGVFVANDGVHVYNEQLVGHEELLALLRRGEIHAAMAAEAVALAKAAIAQRGLNFTVTQDYYTLALAERKLENARKSLDEAQHFLDLTQKLERGGEEAHADVVKAQLQLQQRQRDVQEAELAVQKAKLALAVLIFPKITVDFSIVDDLDRVETAAPAPQLNLNPIVAAAQSTLQQARNEVSIARYGYLPSFALDVFYGIDANQFAARTNSPTQDTGRSTLPNYEIPFRQNLGYSAEATLTIPIWNWGSIHSKVKQAEYRERQAQVDLNTAQKQFDADVANAQSELEAARSQTASLVSSADLARENLRLTLLRYQAGESTALEVVDAETTLRDARSAVDDGWLRYRVAVANVQNLTGAH